MKNIKKSLMIVLALPAIWATMTFSAQAQVVTSISNCTQLQGMANNLNGSYFLSNDIDCSATNPGSPLNASSIWANGQGFVPVGGTAGFSGFFDGQNHTISNLYINNPNQYVGLFSINNGNAVLTNVKMTNASITANNQPNIGALVGINNGYITNVQVQGNISGSAAIGGLAGVNQNFIQNSSAVTNVISTGSSGTAGGLVGYNQGSILQSYAQGSLNGCTSIGGLVGQHIGRVINSVINDSYANVNINITPNCADNQPYVGGLIGASSEYSNSNSATITVNRSFSTGTITYPASINSFYVGGSLGYRENLVTYNSIYWNKTIYPNGSNAGGVGISSAQMQEQSTFDNWDFAGTWRMGAFYPQLQWEPIMETVTLNLTGTGAGTFTSSSSGFNCTLSSGSSTGTCSASFLKNQPVSLIFNSSNRNPSAVTNWGGCTPTTSTGCSFTPDQNIVLNIAVNPVVVPVLSGMLVNSQTGLPLTVTGPIYPNDWSITLTGPSGGPVSVNQEAFPNFQTYNLPAGMYNVSVNLEGHPFTINFTITAANSIYNHTTLKIPVNLQSPTDAS